MSRRVIPGLEPPDAALENDIRVRLDDVEEALEKAVLADSDLLAETASHLLSAGGKRFRPMLVLLSGYFGDPTDPRLIAGSVSIELVHQATLYHDDVIDEADSRHGVPSANARWDNTVAILTGDYLFARASEISTDLGPEICRLLARTIATLCDGQIREVDVSRTLRQEEQSYMEIIRRKTGALIATSCRLGGMLSDASAADTDTLETFGEALGMAFQLSDDIMDIAASESELEKEPGADIRNGLYTLPVLYALKRGDDREELSALLSDGPPAGDRLERALEIARADATLDLARMTVTAEVARALSLASKLPLGAARSSLESLARYLAVRCGAVPEPARQRPGH